MVANRETILFQLLMKNLDIIIITRLINIIRLFCKLKHSYTFCFVLGSIFLHVVFGKYMYKSVKTGICHNLKTFKNCYLSIFPSICSVDVQKSFSRLFSYKFLIVDQFKDAAPQRLPLVCSSEDK